MRGFFVFMSLALILAGCSPSTGRVSRVPTPEELAASSVSRAHTPEELAVIEVARKAVAQNDVWSDRAIYDAERDGDGWSVIVWRIEGYNTAGHPQFVPGGHRTVLIDKNGVLTGYLRGE